MFARVGEIPQTPVSCTNDALPPSALEINDQSDQFNYFVMETPEQSINQKSKEIVCDADVVRLPDLPNNNSLELVLSNRLTNFVRIDCNVSIAS